MTESPHRVAATAQSARNSSASFRDPPGTASRVVKRAAEPVLWTSREVATLRKNAHCGVAFVAELLGRSTSSVKAQAQRQRISLRRKGSRRGVCMGQCRGTSWTSDAKARQRRDLVITGAMSMAVAEEEIRAEVQGTVELCPHCAVRPITMRTTGLCRACHFRLLARKQEDAIAALEGRRAFDSARWRLKRRLSDAARQDGREGATDPGRTDASSPTAAD